MAVQVNETNERPHLTNRRGTASIAHHDDQDCGDAEFFINLQPNQHLDGASGGYCVWAEIAGDDDASFQTVDAIAKAIAVDDTKRPLIHSIEVV